MEAVDARKSRKLGQRNVLGKMLRQVVEHRCDDMWTAHADIAVRRGAAVAGRKLDERRDQQRLARKLCLRMFKHAMENGKAVGKRCIAHYCIREKWRGRAPPSCLFNCC